MLMNLPERALFSVLPIECEEPRRRQQMILEHGIREITANQDKIGVFVVGAQEAR